MWAQELPVLHMEMQLTALESRVGTCSGICHCQHGVAGWLVATGEQNLLAAQSRADHTSGKQVLIAVLVTGAAAEGSEDWTFSKTSGATEPLKPDLPSALVVTWGCYTGGRILD